MSNIYGRNCTCKVVGPKSCKVPWACNHACICKISPLSCRRVGEDHYCVCTDRILDTCKSVEHLEFRQRTFKKAAKAAKAKHDAIKWGCGVRHSDQLWSGYND